ncbi:MAG: hypothetical protein NT002_09870 [candidate division Zixibacteria bacterium]|nr:hypothetical protein [candidate division Zixibacteria bacterium]
MPSNLGKRGADESEFLISPNLEKSIENIYTPQMKAALEKAAADANLWITAKNDPIKYLRDCGIALASDYAIRLEDSLVGIAGELPVPPMCPAGYHPVLVVEKKTVCVHWGLIVRGTTVFEVAGKVIVKGNKVRVCLRSEERLVGTWVCEPGE